MLILLDLKNEVNVIHLIFAKELDFQADRVKFLKETFWVANISLEVVFKMCFLTLNNANIKF